MCPRQCASTLSGYKHENKYKQKQHSLIRSIMHRTNRTVTAASVTPVHFRTHLCVCLCVCGGGVGEPIKEGNVLFNDALNTFYLRLYGVGHMVKDHSDSERGNPMPPHGLLSPISSKGSFICIIPQTG